MLRSFVCSDAAAQLDEQRTWHAQECKGLMLQIRYLKAKFMRESDLRADLGHQKGYLQQLIGGLELRCVLALCPLNERLLDVTVVLTMTLRCLFRNGCSEKATLALIADLGLSRGTPRPPPASPFKHAALAVRAIARMR